MKQPVEELLILVPVLWETDSVLAHVSDPNKSQAWQHFFTLYDEKKYSVDKQTEIAFRDTSLPLLTW